MTTAPLAPKILIVDDEQDFCDLFKFQFQKENFEVFTASKIDEGISRILEHSPECIVLDIRLSNGEDGLTFIRRLRGYRGDDPDVQQRIRRVPVIILTAAGMQMKSLFQAEGATDYVEKPYDIAKLKATILQAIEKAAKGKGP